MSEIPCFKLCFDSFHPRVSIIIVVATCIHIYNPPIARCRLCISTSRRSRPWVFAPVQILKRSMTPFLSSSWTGHSPSSAPSAGTPLCKTAPDNIRILCPRRRRRGAYGRGVERAVAPSSSVDIVRRIRRSCVLPRGFDGGVLYISPPGEGEEFASRWYIYVRCGMACLMRTHVLLGVQGDNVLDQSLRMESRYVMSIIDPVAIEHRPERLTVCIAKVNMLPVKYRPIAVLTVECSSLNGRMVEVEVSGRPRQGMQYWPPKCLFRIVSPQRRMMTEYHCLCDFKRALFANA